MKYITQTDFTAILNALEQKSDRRFDYDESRTFSDDYLIETDNFDVFIYGGVSVETWEETIFTDPFLGTLKETQKKQNFYIDHAYCIDEYLEVFSFTKEQINQLENYLNTRC